LCSNAPCGPFLLFLAVKLCCSLWWPFATLCGHVLLLLVILLLVAKLYCYLWSHFTTPCGHTLLLVVALYCSLWSCFICLCLCLFLVVVLYRSLWLHFMCYFYDKIMDYDGEIIFPIKVPLVVEFCASTSNCPQHQHHMLITLQA